MSSRVLAFLPFDPRWIHRLRRIRVKFLRTFDPGGHMRLLIDTAYHMWQTYIGISTLVVLVRNSGDSDDLLWAIAVAAKSLFDVVLISNIGTSAFSLVGSGSKRRGWTLKLVDSACHRISIVVVIVRLQFYISLIIYDSDAVELEFLSLLQKVIHILPRLLIHILVMDVHEPSDNDESRSSLQDNTNNKRNGSTKTEPVAETSNERINVNTSRTLPPATSWARKSSKGRIGKKR